MAKPEGTQDRPGTNHKLYNMIKKYDTGWIYGNVWQAVQLIVNHNFNTTVDNLIVKFFVSSSASGTNAIELVGLGSFNVANYGWTIYNHDLNNIRIQTGSAGFVYISPTGLETGIVNGQVWYYKVVVYKINL